LDNECSNALKDYMTEQNIDYQLVPPTVHRRNSAERAIRTFKNHFVAGLCSVDRDFPMHLWDKLLPQAELTLNILRGSRLNPKLSAWAQLNGTYDFNRTPIAPPGTRVLVHEKPATRDSWAPHAIDGWYIGPALDSYRCYTVWIQETRAERICDTISWFPTQVKMPTPSTDDLILASLLDIHSAITHPAPTSPVSVLADTHAEELTTIANILSNIVQRRNDLAQIKQNVREEITSPTTPPPIQPAIIPHHPEETAPSLRVMTQEEGDVPPAKDNTPQPHSPQQQTVRYHEATGPAAQRKRRQKQKQTTPRAATTPKKRKAPTNKKKKSQPKNKHEPTHNHGTRANQNIIIAATAAADFLHAAFHGNAFNPDTNQIAEYPELAKCSEGYYWVESFA